MEEGGKLSLKAIYLGLLLIRLMLIYNFLIDIDAFSDCVASRSVPHALVKLSDENLLMISQLEMSCQEPMKPKRIQLKQLMSSLRNV